MMRAVSVPSADRTVRILAATIGYVFFAALVIEAIDRPVPVLAVPIVLLAGIGIVRFPVATVGLVMFLVPFNTAIFSAVGGRAHIAVGPLEYWKDFLIVALFARAFVGRLMTDRRLPMRDAGDNLLIFLIVAYIAIALLSPSRSTVGPALGRYIEGPLLLLTIRFLQPTRKELWRLAGAMLTVATIIGAAAVIERLGPRIHFQNWYGPDVGEGRKYFFLGSTYRAGSFLHDPLILGFYLAAATPLAVAVAMGRRRLRTLAVLAVVACAGGLVVTLTRSGYIGGGLAVCVVLSMTVRNPAVRVSLIGIAIVIAGSVALSYLASGNQTLTREGSNTAHQEALTRDVNLLIARPFGYGLGTTDRNNLRAGVGSGQLGATESSYMARALEGGIQGLTLYLIALYVTFMRLRSVRLRARRAGDREGTALAAGAIGAMIGIGVAGLFLGVHELVVEMTLWGPAGIALAWPVRAQRPGSLVSAAPEAL